MVVYTTCQANTKKGNEKDMNHLGIDVAGKKKIVEQQLKMTKERYWMNSSLVMMEMAYTTCFQEYNHMENVLLKSSFIIYRKHVDENSRHT